MSNEQIKTLLKEKIINKLKNGEFKMKPKAHFILKTILAILGFLIVSLFTLFLISFISFILRTDGIGPFPIFRMKELGLLIFSLPWILIILAALLIIVLELLFKHFAFAYKRPILYSVLAIVLIVALGTIVIDRTPFHPGLFNKAMDHRLPIFGPMYREFGPQDRIILPERMYPPKFKIEIR
jgi:hypothetical protein